MRSAWGILRYGRTLIYLDSASSPYEVGWEPQSHNSQSDRCILGSGDDHVEHQRDCGQHENQRGPWISGNKVGAGQVRILATIDEDAGCSKSVENPGHEHRVAHQLLELPQT